MTDRRGVVIKQNAELRHTLAHLFNAIECLIDGNTAAAQYELDEIRGLIFVEDGEPWPPENDLGEEGWEEGLQEEVAQPVTGGAS